MNDDNAPKPWWSYRAAGEVAFADVSARNARRDARARRNRDAHSAPAPAGDATDPGDPPPAPIAADRSGLAAGIVAAFALGFVLLDAQAGVAPIAGRVLLPIFGIAAAAAVGPKIVRRHPDEAWLPRLLVGAMVFKLFATYLRYQVFQGQGDAVS